MKGNEKFHHSFTPGICDQCGKRTHVYIRQHSGQKFCKECLNKSIERIINKTISQFNMLSPEDKIIVGLSGGKDSIVLLYNLIKVQSKVYNAKPLIALSIDEGINGYRSNAITIAKKFCERYNITHKIFSFKDKIGKSLNEIIELKKKDPDFRYPCNYCATIRRRLLNDIAKELGGTILALGHNLTDISETYLMNILYKRFHLIAQQSINVDNDTIVNKYYLKKINPLMKLPENEIQLYAEVNNLDFYSIKCPYRKKYPILRKKVLDFILKLKETSPEIEFNLFNGFLELSNILKEGLDKVKPKNCSNCGYLTSNDKVCSYCKLLRELE